MPPGATKEEVALGDRIFHGEIGGATCAGCHGSTPRAPGRAGSDIWHMLWGDGSLPAIAQTITNGVPEPKELFRRHAADGRRRTFTGRDQSPRRLCLGVEPLEKSN